MHVIWRISGYFRKHRALFALTLALALVMTAASLAVPAVVREVLRRVGESAAAGSSNAIGITSAVGTDGGAGVAADVAAAATAGGASGGADVAQAVLLGAVAILLLQLVREVFNCLRIRVNNTAEQRILADIRRDLHGRLLELPVSFYDKNKSGETASRVIDDVANVERALLDGTEQGLSALLTLGGVLAALFWMNSALAAVVCAPLPVVLAIGIWYNKRTSRRWKGVREAAADLNSLLVEDIQGNRLIQSFALQPRERARFDAKVGELARRTLRAMFQWSLYSPGMSFLGSLGAVAVFVAGGWFVATGRAGFGYPDLIAFYMYAVMLYEPLSRMSALNQLLAAGKASGARVFEILDHPVDIAPPAQPRPFPDAPVGAVFENVTFAYDGRPPVLADFHLALPAGKTTALAGHTGAGKSTVAALLMRSYDVRAGRVTINGTDVRDFDPADLRQHVGHVAQDPFLFDGTVAENLRLARPDADDDALRAALESAAALEFVERLPHGLDTQIGEKGVRLSQGEKQRLTIARVLLKNPPLVILDEATSSVDTITERQIQRALENLGRGRTLLIIAHRLSTIRRADQIVVLENGRVTEQGTHAELLARPARYAALWRHQTSFEDTGE